ncbi:MAG: DUF5131 family protein [Polyangiales bacterium]
MSEDTGIAWATNTFNPWWGCMRVSPACEHCYAERHAARVANYMAKLWGRDRPGKLWGPNSNRMIAPDHIWDSPVLWNDKAARDGSTVHVFCASMCDIFEDRRDLDPHRARLWELVEATPHLRWLLLTKRPEFIASMVPAAWMTAGFPVNAWVGVTAENQKYFDERVPVLATIPTSVRFISAEPLLGPIDVSQHAASLQWIIAGGESGPGARPMEVEWARSLREQATSRNIPFFFKQWGNWRPDTEGNGLIKIKNKDTRDLDGAEWSQMPEGSYPIVRAPSLAAPLTHAAPIDLSTVPTAALLAEIQRRMRASTTRS